MHELIEQTEHRDDDAGLRYRLSILRRRDGFYAVEVERWEAEDVPDYGRVWEGWMLRTASGILGDLDIARRTAQEYLRTYVHGEHEPLE